MNAGGATATAVARQQQENEEETLTAYRRADLSEDWEFKILRSAAGAFGKSELLRCALEDEALSGWVLVEKFDNHRVRLKRQRGENDDERNPFIDPYRTVYGNGKNGQMLTRLTFAVIAVVAIGAAMVLFR
ncbi:MAG: hypothetical protein VB858_13075 [Planctomycetaceae bacterium]